jgi:protein CWC15
MTTAHRPTWKAAVGKASEGGFDSGGALSSMRSSKDASAHTKLKYRSAGQQMSKAEVIQRSLEALDKAKGGGVGRRVVDESTEKAAVAALEGECGAARKEVDVAVLNKYDDGDDDDEVDFGGDGEKAGAAGAAVESDESDLDANSDDDDSDSDSDDDSDDDEEVALAAELAKIRAEKEAAKRAAEEKERKEEEAKLTEAAMLGNPLLQHGGTSSSGGGVMKRKWNDDVVFRNQARKEPEGQKRFINDTVRNDFHKRFMDKFMR